MCDAYNLTPLEREAARRADIVQRFITEARTLPGVPRPPAHDARLRQLARTYRHELDPANPSEACETLTLEFYRRHPW